MSTWTAPGFVPSATALAVERLRRAPDSYAESFTMAAEGGLIDRSLAASLLPSAGMRNVLVHAYLDVDHDLIAAAMPLALEQYGRYVREAAEWLRSQSPQD